MLQAALDYAALGLAVVVLRPRTKKPIFGKWQKFPLKTPEEINKAFSQKDRNIGIIIGKNSGVVAIDIDGNHGAPVDVLNLFPRTVTMKTRNGFHLYFKYPSKPIECHELIPPQKGKTWNQAPAYLYTKGRQFVAAPSVVSFDNEGNELVPYEYGFHADAGGALSFADCELAELPDWCFENLAVVDEKPQVGGRKYGENLRHAMFKKTAIAMRAQGKSAEQIKARLLERNARDCNPPKEGADEELNNLVRWAIENVQVREKGGEFLLPLGFNEGTYYFTSSFNQQIKELQPSGFTPNNLVSLMPYDYWQERYPAKNGISWIHAASDLMQECHDVGIYNPKKVRGIGAWKQDEKLILHLGNHLLVDGKPEPLQAFGDRFIYKLSRDVTPPDENALTAEQCKPLVEACDAFNWRRKSDGALLAGALAVARVCGALPWRPHIWITGASGCGKSTIMRDLVKNVMGDFCAFFLGNTTEAGIRQKIKCDAVPVIFDEAETNNKKSSLRVQNVIELIRQASSDNEAVIAKGTASGDGHEFKITSSFFLSSIRVNLPDEADQNRFAVLDLDRPDATRWEGVKRKIEAVDAAFGNRLFARTVSKFDVLMKSREVLEKVIAEKKTARDGQQYGILLAGYWLLSHETPITLEESKKLLELLELLEPEHSEHEQDEWLCLNHLFQGQAQIVTGINGERTTMSLFRALELGAQSTDVREQLLELGLNRREDKLFISNCHSFLSKVFNDTKWSAEWSRSLRRLPSSKAAKQKFGSPRTTNCVELSMSALWAASSSTE